MSARPGPSGGYHASDIPTGISEPGGRFSECLVVLVGSIRFGEVIGSFALTQNPEVLLPSFGRFKNAVA